MVRGAWILVRDTGTACALRKGRGGGTPRLFFAKSAQVVEKKADEFLRRTKSAKERGKSVEVIEKNVDTHGRGVAQDEKDGSGRTEVGLANWSVEVTKQISMRMFICQVICTMAFERSGLSWLAE